MENTECLKKHADIAIECDVPKENTFVLTNGDVLSMKKGIVKKALVIFQLVTRMSMVTVLVKLVMR